jgi:hypothetical protein
MQGIQAVPQNVEQIRERLRKMSDLELREHGRAAVLKMKCQAKCALWSHHN